ncbi:bifunctional GINS subunit [Babesia duncani]|uniref:Bifunctional GINS subunit n=1 Tax=Babesia duncani TaxID=323732 RepID=A0AAD9UNI8_9APIC|nr:bifunctional GINS subunit [Babesia duncani]
MRDLSKGDSVSFDFFRKRKRPEKSQVANGKFIQTFNTFAGYISPALSQTTESGIHASQRSYKSSSSNSRRGTFRGLLTNSQDNQTHTTNGKSDHIETIEEPVPLPEIDLELCKAVNYMIWARDQMVFGNVEILSQSHLEAQFVVLVEELGRKIHNAASRNDSITTCIANAIYDRMSDVQTNHAFLSNNSNPHCRLSIVHLNGCVYIRPVDYNKYCFDGIKGGAMLELEGNGISQPIFIEQHLWMHVSRKCEMLPSKLSGEYIHRHVEIKYDYVANLITKVLFQRATRELVVIKALVDLPSFQLAQYEGYDLEPLKTGERAWLPIYISQRLSHIGACVVELPQFLHLDKIREIRALERASQDLQKLDNPFYFELAYIFTKAKLISKLQVPCGQQNSMFRYISKIAGVVDDLKYLRASKINRGIPYIFLVLILHAALERLPLEESIIQLENIQYSETYMVNQILPAYCSRETTRKCLEQLPSMQIGLCILKSFHKIQVTW